MVQPFLEAEDVQLIALRLSLWRMLRCWTSFLIVAPDQATSAGIAGARGSIIPDWRNVDKSMPADLQFSCCLLLCSWAASVTSVRVQRAARCL